MAITHQNTPSEMALDYDGIIIRVANTAEKGVVDIEQNYSRVRLKIHAVPLVRDMGKDTMVLPKM
jgi:hypothetical protein